MAKVKPFKGLRPRKDIAGEVSCLPYDVMSIKEAKEMAKGNSSSFLRVVRSEIDLDDNVDCHDKLVYKKAKENLDEFIKKGILFREEKEVYYIYRQIMEGRSQVGICGCASIDDYENNIIKKHEFTRPEKEQDRINNFLACNAHTEPVFFAYRKNEELSTVINNWINNNVPEYDFISEDNICHTLWVVNDDEIIKKIRNIFENMPCLYIADGHHRTASSYQVGKKKRVENPSYNNEEEFNYILAVMFSEDELKIMDYNRLVKNLNGLSKEEFLDKISEKFIVKEVGNEIYYPLRKHEFSMYIDKKWYSLTAKEGTYNKTDSVLSLDASILQDNLLNPILRIKDPRTDNNIEFIGGIRGLGELVKRVDEKENQVAFAVYPVTMEDLFLVADDNKVMPPKSTWFEPKLRSGLFIHEL